MTQRPTHVPKFGNWDANDHVPFTAVFDNARARKGGGKIINPNDPSESSNAFGVGSEPSPGNSFQQQYSVETSPFREYQYESTKEDNYNSPPLEQRAGRPAHRDSPGYYKPGNTGRPARPTAADGFRRGSPGGGGTELIVGDSPVPDQSPNHPAAYQGRLGNRPGSPYSSWERKVLPEGGSVSSAATPGKSRLRSGVPRGDETPDRGPVLPKFGAWDEKDPFSGEGFTVIFNQARTEKKAGGPVRIPPLQAESPARMDYGDDLKQPYQAPRNYVPQRKPYASWSCCFQTPAVE